MVSIATPLQRRGNLTTLSPVLQTPDTRIVLFGASNLFLTLPTALRLLLANFPRTRLSITCAQGPGRSYGVNAGVLGVKFTGILASGALEALEAEHERSASQPGWALLTDVGNDVPYGSGVERILGWVGETIERLRALNLRIAVTALPVEPVQSLNAIQFTVLRSLYFPRFPRKREDVQREVREIDAGLGALCERRCAKFLASDPLWYSLDRIHLKRDCWSLAWRSWIGGLLERELPPSEERIDRSDLAVRFHRPVRYFFLGRERRGRSGAWSVAPRANLTAY